MTDHKDTKVINYAIPKTRIALEYEKARDNRDEETLVVYERRPFNSEGVDSTGIVHYYNLLKFWNKEERGNGILVPIIFEKRYSDKSDREIIAEIIQGLVNKQWIYQDTTFSAKPLGAKIGYEGVIRINRTREGLEAVINMNSQPIPLPEQH